MKRPFAILLAATCFASACLAEPEPPETPEIPPAEETAIEAPAPVIRPLVGGGCAYERTVIGAPVVEVQENTVLLNDPAARNFNLPPVVFAEAPQVGDIVNVTKVKIIRGSCQPLIYTYAGPEVALTPVAPAN